MQRPFVSLLLGAAALVLPAPCAWGQVANLNPQQGKNDSAGHAPRLARWRELSNTARHWESSQGHAEGHGLAGGAARLRNDTRRVRGGAGQGLSLTATTRVVWSPLRGRGSWVAPESGSPNNPRSARWRELDPTSRRWESSEGSGVWQGPASGPLRPQNNEWRSESATTTARLRSRTAAAAAARLSCPPCCTSLSAQSGSGLPRVSGTSQMTTSPSR